MLGEKFLVVVAALGLTVPVWAQPDEPGRGVVRISVLNGDVSVRRGDSGDYVAAAVNAPLVLQDRVLTGAASRAELQFDWANFLRLSHDAEVRLAELEYRRYIVQVARGTVTWRVLRDQDAYVEISTPNVSVRPVRQGIYRVTVLDDGSSEITVRSGEAEIFTPRGSERLRSGRTMFARGTAADPEFRIAEEIPDDDWDRWNIARDRDLDCSRSYQYVSRDIYGAEDLDAHGRWVHAGGYGYVWAPRVAAGWAPYRYGRWSWLDWYGWSWVSYDPWGWAPYHYGRWFWHAPVGWCWWPGAFGGRHYWSPGLVAFVGFGNVGVGFGWGRVGWIPLGPHEPFHRWWGGRWYGGYRNRNYIDNSVTVVNNVNITNVYRNSRINNGVTVVDQDGFRRGRFNESIRVSGDELRGASLAQGPLPVTPGRESLRLVDRETSVRGIERSGAERFFSRSRPAQVERVAFEDQRRGIEQIARRSSGENPGRSVVDAREADARPGNAVAESGRSVVDGSPGTATAEQRGWRRANEPARGSTPERAVERSNVERFGSPRVADSAAAADQRGWRRADEPARGATPERAVERSNVERGSGSDWRRFGSPRVTEGTDASRGSGRGFGEPLTPGGAENPERGASGSGRAPDAAQPTTGRAPADDWRRFGGGSSGRTAPSDTDRGTRRDFDGSSSGTRGGRSFENLPRETQPSEEGGSGRSSESPRIERRDWGGSRGSDRSESIRISPPIVRERADFGGRSAPAGGDSGSRSGRSYEVPRSAPGGDGGGMRGGGGVRGGADGGVRSAPSSGRADGGGGGRSGSRGR